MASRKRRGKSPSSRDDSPEKQLAAQRRRYEKSGPDTVTSFGDALEVLSELRKQLVQLHQDAGRTRKQGNYIDAADIAWQIGSAFKLEGFPERPRTGTVMGFIKAKNFITRCRTAFHNRSRPEYWKWRYAQCPRRSDEGFIEWHLDNMRQAWDGHGALPSRTREAADEYVRKLRTEFQHIHELWAVPSGFNPDYIEVAIEAHRVVADAMPTRDPPPSSRVSFSNLTAYIVSLQGRLQENTGPSPADARATSSTDDTGKPKFDTTIYKSLDAKIKATAPQRTKLEREWKQERDHRKSIERAYDLLMLIAHGTKEQPISTAGRVVIPARTWATQIQKTAKELLRCAGPYKRGNLPTFIVPYRTEGEGHVVARTALDLALRGASLSDIAAALGEGLSRLRQLHAEGVPQNVRDSECGIEDYYSNLLHAFMRRSDELWVEDHAALDLVIHLGRRPDGSIGRLGPARRPASTSPPPAKHTPAIAPKEPRDVIGEAKVLGDCSQCMITKDAFHKFVNIDIDPAHLTATKPRMPDPVWKAQRNWPWYRVSDLIVAYQRIAKTDLSRVPLNSKIRKKLKPPDAVPPWHEQATRRPSSDPST